MNKTQLACWVLSRQALPTARLLRKELQKRPWLAPNGQSIAECIVCTPRRLAEEDCLAFEHLQQFLATNYRLYAGHICLGACGIAVRALAPLLEHKSLDPPVVVSDSCGHFVISLLSGHWGGGNALTRHLAHLIGGEAVITTASDQQESVPALDLLAHEAGLRIVDWSALPQAQAALLEGQQIALWDPCNALPSAQTPFFQRLHKLEEKKENNFLIVAHWRKMQAQNGCLRLAVPHLYLGIGCKSNIETSVLLASVQACCEENELEIKSLAALATVQEKSQEKALLALADQLTLPLRLFSAKKLATCKTPNPSVAAGRHFNLPPFSVCESAALLVAQQQSAIVQLVVPKTSYHHCVTLAVAKTSYCNA